MDTVSICKQQLYRPYSVWSPQSVWSWNKHSYFDISFLMICCISSSHSYKIVSTLGSDKNGTLGFREFLGPGCTNIKKSLCPSSRGDPEDSKTHPTFYFSIQKYSIFCVQRQGLWNNFFFFKIVIT